MKRSWKRGKRVIDEKSAYIMANMMKGVIERGTGHRARALKRPVAGKTGTSNDHMDTWFIGYTPQWVGGAWVGLDLKEMIGKEETGGRTAAPVWIDFMNKFLPYYEEQSRKQLLAQAKAEAKRLGLEQQQLDSEALDFRVPDGVEPVWIDRSSGLLANERNESALLEYFVAGTEPRERFAPEGANEDYLSAFDL